MIETTYKWIGLIGAIGGLVMLGFIFYWVISMLILTFKK